MGWKFGGLRKDGVKIFRPVPGQGVRSLFPGARKMERFIRDVKMGKEKEQIT